MKRFFKNTVNNNIFRPPKYIKAKGVKVEKLTLPNHNGGFIPYCISTDLTNPDKEPGIVIRILYNHGNSEDIMSSYPHIELFLIQLKKHFIELNPLIICILWDYPTYGESTLTLADLDIETLEEQAKLIWDTLITLPPTSPQNITYNIVLGYSIGTSMACYLAKEVDCDLIWLQAPFKELISGSGRNHLQSVIGPWISNKEYLMKKNKNVRIYAIYAERDEWLDYSKNGLDVDWSILKHNADHEWFIGGVGSVECGQFFAETLMNLYQERNKVIIEANYDKEEGDCLEEVV